MEIFTLTVVALMVGILGPFLGIGAGMITIPSLMFLYPQLPPQTAMGTTLALTLLGSCRNSWAFYRKGKRWHWNIVGPIVIFMLLASLPAGQLALLLPPFWAKRLLGIYLCLAAVQVFFFGEFHGVNGEEPVPAGPRKMLQRGIWTGIAVGTTSVLTGVGGGIILIPILLNVYKIPQLQVPIYTNGMMIFSCTFALLTYLPAGQPTDNPLPTSLLFSQVGQVNLLLAGLLFLVGTCSYPIGFWLNKVTPPARMKKIFFGLMILMGSKLLLGF